MKRIFAAARVLRAARNTNGRVKLWRSNATGQTAAARRACRITASCTPAVSPPQTWTPISRARRRTSSTSSTTFWRATALTKRGCSQLPSRWRTWPITARSTPCGTPGSWTAMNRRAASRAASWPCRNTKLKFR